ncbi:hypothetical protein L204_100101 [Cryptococcus depauperatus]|nr:hypothetical protein L204_02418 [Cryptococcus depauperatus CBS 7855]
MLQKLRLYAFPINTISQPSFQRLEPVYALILQHLCRLSPLKTLTLSRELYEQSIKVLYRDVTVSAAAVEPLHDPSSSSYQRAIDAFSYSEVLRIPDWQAVEEVLALVEHFSSGPGGVYSLPPDKRIFKNVGKIEVGWKVLKEVQEFENTDLENSYCPELSYLALASLLGNKFSELIVHVGSDERGRPYDTNDIVLFLSPEITTYIAHGTLKNPVYLQALGSSVRVKWPGAKKCRLVLSMEEDFYDPEMKEAHAIHDNYVYPTSLAIYQHLCEISRTMQEFGCLENGPAACQRIEYYLLRPQNVQISMAMQINISASDTENLEMMDVLEGCMFFYELKDGIWRKLDVTKNYSDDCVPIPLLWSSLFSLNDI